MPYHYTVHLFDPVWNIALRYAPCLWNGCHYWIPPTKDLRLFVNDEFTPVLNNQKAVSKLSESFFSLKVILFPILFLKNILPLYCTLVWPNLKYWFEVCSLFMKRLRYLLKRIVIDLSGLTRNERIWCLCLAYLTQYDRFEWKLSIQLTIAMSIPKVYSLAQSIPWFTESNKFVKFRKSMSFSRLSVFCYLGTLERSVSSQDLYDACLSLEHIVQFLSLPLSTYGLSFFKLTQRVSVLVAISILPHDWHLNLILIMIMMTD